MQHDEHTVGGAEHLIDSSSERGEGLVLNEPGYSPVTPLPEIALSEALPPLGPGRVGTGRRSALPLLVAMSLLLVASAVLIPSLVTTPAARLTVPQQQNAPEGSGAVGNLSFSSSGQMDPQSSRGLNDIITLSLPSFTPPGPHTRDYAWLEADDPQAGPAAILLGTLQRVGGGAQLTYQDVGHRNLLTAYSRLLVTEQSGSLLPATPAPDPKTWRFQAAIPDSAAPADEQHYSLLSHLRHLLAKDPTLQQIGLQGGLDIWLYRNAEKILEWSSAARDNWAGGQQTALIHRHMIRVLDYLDGTAAVYSSGDLPPGAPLMVDPQQGRVGLLELHQSQVLPAYLKHIDIHLQGLINAPGATSAQRHLAAKIDTALNIDAFLLQNVHRDAVHLASMSDAQLKTDGALSFLNDMVTSATTAYTGHFDPSVGGNVDGFAWVHGQLEELASIPVTAMTH